MYKLEKELCNATTIYPIKVIKDPLGKKRMEPGIVPDNFTLIRHPASYRLGDKKTSDISFSNLVLIS